MKKLLTIASAVALLASAGAFAKDGAYVSAKVGGAKPTFSAADDKNFGSGTGKTDFDAGFAAGYRFGNVAVEGEFDYFKSKEVKLDGTEIAPDTKTYSYLANGIYTFDVQSVPVKPYVGAGLGFVNVSEGELVGSKAGESANRAAYQGIVGASYAVNSQVDLTADYRYLSTFEKSDRSVQKNSVNVGLAYNF